MLHSLQWYIEVSALPFVWIKNENCIGVISMQLQMEADLDTSAYPKS